MSFSPASITGLVQFFVLVSLMARAVAGSPAVARGGRAAPRRVARGRRASPGPRHYGMVAVVIS